MTDPTHSDILAALKALEGKVEALSVEVAATKDIMHAVSAVKLGGGLIMWVGKVLLGLGIAIVVVKSGFTALFGLGATHGGGH